MNYSNIDEIQGEERLAILEPLESELLVNKVGVKVISTTKAVTIPSVNSVTASVEGEVTELVGQKLDFAKRKVEPFRVGISLPFSRKAILEADINLVNYALNIEAKAEATLLNKIMFGKTAVSGQKGLFVDAYAATGATAAKSVALTGLTYADIVGLRTVVANKDVPFDSTAAYVCSPNVAAQLLTTPKSKNIAAGFIAERGDVQGIQYVDGYPVLISTVVDDSYMGFGVFSNALIQRVGAPSVVVDNISRSKEDITEVNFNTYDAIDILRPEAFAVLKLS